MQLNPLSNCCLPNMYIHAHVIQWNPSYKDTIGTAQSVLIKGGVIISGVE